MVRLHRLKRTGKRKLFDFSQRSFFPNFSSAIVCLSLCLSVCLHKIKLLYPFRNISIVHTRSRTRRRGGGICRAKILHDLLVRPSKVAILLHIWCSCWNSIPKTKATCSYHVSVVTRAVRLRTQTYFRGTSDSRK